VLPTPNATAPWRFDFPTPIVYPTPNNWRPPVVGVPLSVRAQDHFWFARPIASDSVNWPLGSYRYGADYFGQMNIHAGIDIDAPPYTPILAAGPGEVVWAGWGLFNFKPGLEDDPYGIAVAIKHDFGYEGQTLYTLYAHLTAENVFVGQQVQTGEVIGWVGSTGNSTGPHVHFEVRVGRNDYFATRNPELWIAPYAGWGVLAGQLLNAGGAPIPSTLINIFDAHRKYAATIYTYGPRVARPDDDWRENFAISDLPAGNYYLEAHIATSDNTTETLGGEVTVVAGQTNFVILQAKTGIFANLESPLGTRPPYLPSVTPTLTPTPSPTGTNTPTRTASPTRTPTRTRVPTNTVTPTRTRIPTHTPTPRFSPTPTLTLTPRPPTITPLVTIGPLP
jgi:murein DD-endopeptidase MepM/ murein hydrolase activator NlpD